MDTRIPLMGQPLDFAGSLSSGLQAGMMQRQAQQQNALGALYQAQGPQIMAGEPGALNALARMDPQAAIGIQAQKFNMDQARQQAQQATAEAARKLSAEQLAAAAAQAEQALAGAVPLYSRYKAGDAAAGQQLAQYLQSHGITATPDNVDQLMFQSQTVVETLKAFQGMQPKPAETWRPATPEEAAQYGAAGGQIGPGGKFDPINPPSGGIQFDPETGRVLSIGGAGKAPKPATEAEAKNAGFLIRMRDSQDVLNQFEDQGTDLMANVMAMDPTGLSNYGQSPEYQRYDQAKRDFINAVLRRESGAVIGPDEFANAERQYFPRPGDTPAVIEQKRKNRANAIAGVTVGAGASTQAPLVAGTAETGTDFQAMDLTALTRVDVTKLNEQQLADFMAALEKAHQ